MQIYNVFLIRIIQYDKKIRFFFRPNNESNNFVSSFDDLICFALAAWRNNERSRPRLIGLLSWIESLGPRIEHSGQVPLRMTLEANRSISRRALLLNSFLSNGAPVHNSKSPFRVYFSLRFYPRTRCKLSLSLSLDFNAKDVPNCRTTSTRWRKLSSVRSIVEFHHWLSSIQSNLELLPRARPQPWTLHVSVLASFLTLDGFNILVGEKTCIFFFLSDRSAVEITFSCKSSF